jgi:phosphatidylserine/phosphatidylglycerophosphate/cardiolipin synthase-like enzyme
MTIELVYHRETDAASPFDACAIGIARGADLRIACPYLTLGYLRRLVGVSASWRLLTEIEEWLRSLGHRERTDACGFIAENESRVRHLAGLHAKVLIGSRGALVGSANFTTSGIQRRTEMAVFVQDESSRQELVKWFDAEWERGSHVPGQRLNSFAQALPFHLPNPEGITLFEDRIARLAPLDYCRR